MSLRVWLAALLLALSAQPAAGLDADTLGVVINDADPYSVAIGRYYVERRKIPARNVLHVSFAVARDLSPDQFTLVKRELDRSCRRRSRRWHWHGRSLIASAA